MKLFYSHVYKVRQFYNEFGKLYRRVTFKDISGYV